jgi:hypothetical protein
MIGFSILLEFSKPFWIIETKFIYAEGKVVYKETRYLHF